MDRGIWATWYDLPAEGGDELLAWLHGSYLPAMLQRRGYLWAANVQNVMTPERERGIYQRLTHTEDPAVPGGGHYLLLFGAESPYTFVDDPPLQLRMAGNGLELSHPIGESGSPHPNPLPQGEGIGGEAEMLRRMVAARQCVFLEVARVDGPEAARRGTGITPGPIIQFGQFNINATANELDMEQWYAATRLPTLAAMPGCVATRKLVSIVGWAKHAIMYEFAWLESMTEHFRDPAASAQSARVVSNLVHAPHSPSLGTRLWPPLLPGQTARPAD